MPNFSEKVAEMSKGAKTTYSPDYSIGAFIAFWDQRMEEIGFDAAKAEYEALAHKFKRHVESDPDIAQAHGTFFNAYLGKVAQ